MSTLEKELNELRENPWDTITLHYNAGEWRCTLQEDFVRDVEGPLCATAVGAVRAAVLASRPRRRPSGGLLVKFYEPGESYGWVVVKWASQGHCHYKEVAVRRPRLLMTRVVPRASHFRLMHDIVRLPGQDPRTVVGFGFEGAALAAHLSEKEGA